MPILDRQRDVAEWLDGTPVSNAEFEAIDAARPLTINSTGGTWTLTNPVILSGAAIRHSVDPSDASDLVRKGYFDSRVGPAETALGTGFAVFYVSSGTYVNDDFYTLTQVSNTGPSDGRVSTASSANTGSGNGTHFSIGQGVLSGEIDGWWEVSVDLTFDVGTSGKPLLELWKHNSSTDPTTGTRVAMWVGTGGTVTNVKGSYLFYATGSRERFSLRVGTPLDHVFPTSFESDTGGLLRRVYVKQISKDIP